jgi:hypothetical protein
VTRKEFLKLQLSLLPELPQFKARGDMMYMPPAASLLRGISFCGSSFGKQKFYVSMFVMPLCVPSKSLTLSFGNRLRIGGTYDNWSDDRPDLREELLEAIKTQAIPFFDSIQSLNEFVEFVEPTSVNSRRLEARGYALTRLGRSKEAIATLGSLLQIEATFQWEVDLAKEASSLLIVLKSDPDYAKELMIKIEQETRTNLKLPEIDSH